jgi:antimicrobial peptide system SdpB family protein
MISKQIGKIDNLINKNYWTNYLGLSRSILSLSLLLTFLLNNKFVLFFTGFQNENYHKFDHIEFNLFSWFDNFETGIIVSIIILTIVTIGILPRYTCIPHWFVVYSFNITSTSIDGGDQVASIITLLLIPICIFDKRIWHWSINNSTYSFFAKVTATFSYYLISLQLFIIYFFASISKFKIEEWKNGTAIYYWMTQPLFGVTVFFKPIIDLILTSPILTTLLNWSVLVLELIIALVIFVSEPKKRRLIIYSAIVFHFLIAIILGIVSFSIIMSAALLILISNNNNSEFRNFYIVNSIINIYNLLFFSTKKN